MVSREETDRYFSMLSGLPSSRQEFLDSLFYPDGGGHQPWLSPLTVSPPSTCCNEILNTSMLFKNYLLFSIF